MGTMVKVCCAAVKARKEFLRRIGSSLFLLEMLIAVQFNLDGHFGSHFIGKERQYETSSHFWGCHKP